MFTCWRKKVLVPLGLLAGALLAGAATEETSPRAGDPEDRAEKQDEKSAGAIARGLEWLALHQAQDGHWSLHAFPEHARTKPLPDGKTFTCDCEAACKFRNDVAATAFGLLPFLAAGHGLKPSDNKPDYSKTVEAGLKYLLGKQNKEGAFDKDMYANALAARTLVDAYALTKDDKLKAAAQKAIDFLVYAQDPRGGGWRYQPRQAGDLSVTSWHFVALRRGQLAGLKMPRQTLKLAERFVDSCESAEMKGNFSYTPGSLPTPSMTAAGLLCRQYSGVGPKNVQLRAGVRLFRIYPPEKRPDLYYLYYANQVMHNLGGDDWRFWYTGVNEEERKQFKGIRDFLLLWQDDGDKAQHGHQKGSWSSTQGSGGGAQGGRLMATSLALLILEQANQPPLGKHKPAIGE